MLSEKKETKFVADLAVLENDQWKMKSSILKDVKWNLHSQWGSPKISYSIISHSINDKIGLIIVDPEKYKNCWVRVQKVKIVETEEMENLVDIDILW